MRRLVLWVSVGLMTAGLIGSAGFAWRQQKIGPLDLPGRLLLACFAIIVASSAAYAVMATMSAGGRLNRWERQAGRVVGWVGLAAALAIVLLA